MTTHKEHFNSLDHLTATLASRPEFKGQHRESRCTASEHWEPLGYDKAAAIAATGGYDPDTAAGITQQDIDMFAEAQQVEAQDWALAPAGVMPCIPAYLAGEPCNMWNPTEAAYTPARVLRINAVMICTADIDAATMRRRGLAILSAIDAAERQNIRVELVASFPSLTSRGRPSAIMTVMVKEAHDTYTPAAVAFLGGNLAAGRRIGFAWLESLPEYTDICADGYGDGHRYTDPTADVFIPYVNTNSPWETDKKAAATVAALFKEAAQ